MSEAGAPTATDVLHSLRLLRSSDPSERKQGITILSSLVDDPRVQQVFEHLYENDSDLSVREMAWHALNRQNPSIPAPGPGPSDLSAKSDHPKAPRPLFLFNPANAKYVARQLHQSTTASKKGRRVVWGLAGFLLLLVGFFGGMALPDWITWYQFRQSGVTVQGIVTGLQVRKQSGGSEHYTVTYRFSFKADDKTESYTGKQDVTEKEYRALAERMPVLVTYLPGDPDSSRLKNTAPGDISRNRLTFVALGLLGLLIVVLVSAAVWRPQPGGWGRHLCRGQVITCTGQVDSDGDFYIKLRYRFWTSSGQMVTNQASRIRNDLKKANLPVEGTPIAVYYRNSRSYQVM